MGPTTAPGERRSLPRTAAVVVFVLGAGIGVLAADRPTEQPFPYNHAVHTAQADCTLCHRGARTQVRAGLPSFDRCLGCHATAPGKPPSAQAEAVWRAAAGGQLPRWNRLYRVPEHVYFSHRRHVMLGGIPCETCHGAMAKATTPPRFPARTLNMPTCIGCHEREQVTVDCSACHR